MLQQRDVVQLGTDELSDESLDAVKLDKQRFELGEHLLDCLPHTRHLVAAEIVSDDRVASRERGRQAVHYSLKEPSWIL